MAGNHLVIPYPTQENPEFYFKVYPEYPLVELFLHDLTKRLGYYPPRDVDLWYWQCGRFDYPVLVSKAVKGKTLQKVLDDHEAIGLNAYAFSQNVLISAFTQLEDNKPDNIMVTQENGQARFVFIDADRWFVPPFKHNQLHVKNIIFCLDNMNQAVDRVFLQDILCLHPQRVLESWIQEMKRLGQAVIELFGGKITDYYRKNRNEEEKSLLLPPLKFHAVYDVFDYFQEIQKLFKDAVENAVPVNHWDILAKINPRLANHYKQTFAKLSDPLERFKDVAEHAYIKGSSKKNTSASIECYTTKMGFKTYQDDMWAGMPEANSIEQNWTHDIQQAERQGKELLHVQVEIEKAQDYLQRGDVQALQQLPQRLKEKILSTKNVPTPVNLSEKNNPKLSRIIPKANYDFLFKIMLVGHTCVGKSTLLTRYCDNIFRPSFFGTIGIDFKVRTTNLSGIKCKLQIWDTAGPERFRTITTSYYRTAHAFLLCVDLTDKETLHKLWIDEIKRHAKEDAIVVMVGTKSDLRERRQISYEEGLAWSKKVGALAYRECSPKTGEGVEEIFDTVSNFILDQYSDRI